MAFSAAPIFFLIYLNKYYRCSNAQLYGILLLVGEQRIISSGLCGKVEQFATIELFTPTLLNPFHINGGTVTNI